MTLRWKSGNLIEGLSSDTKPTNVMNPSYFWETDTFSYYEWNGSTWLKEEDQAETFTNKTISASANTITNIGDSSIATHTSTKISITAKGQLNSAIVYNDQANTYGDFNQVFRSSRVHIQNPANTFGYWFVASAIAADRNVTLPLLTADDTLVLAAFTQTLTNKTIDTASNTISNIGDANIATHTSTKISITSKTQLNSAIVFNDQANTYGDFNQTIRSSRLLITNPANTFNYTIAGAAIAAGRTITLPLLTAGDTMVTEAFTQTLTNKTIAAGSNTISGIVDANIGTHTTTKITTTSKTLLNTAIVYNDQTNTFGAFAQIFPSSQLKIQNPGATFNYIFAGSAIAADRTVTLPLLTGNDILVTAAFTQTLTNKTIDATSNTISNIGDANIATHTSTKISITAKGQLNSAIVFNDAANTFGDFNQTIRSSRLLITNPANTFNYTFVGSAITAARNITIPLLTGDDTLTTAAFTQTLTNKTIATDSNTIKHSTTNNAGDILKNTGSAFDRLARGTALQVLQVNSGATDVAWASLQSETTGKAIASGNGTTTVFTIAHGLGSNPTYAFVDCSSHAITRTFTTDATNITVTFSSAPSSGTNNVIIYWRVIA